MEWLLHGAERPLKAAFGRATGRIRVIAPYIKVDALAGLLASTHADLAVIVVTRWTVRDICAGVSDLAVYDLVSKRPGSSVLLCPRLHAKLYVVDSTECFVGSANVTAAGLGGGDHHNREIMAHLTPVPMPLLQFAAALERESLLATDDLRDEYATLAEAHGPLGTPPEPAKAQGTDSRPRPQSGFRLSDLPRTRHPTGLFRLYAGIETDAHPAALDWAAHDLALFEVPTGLGEAEFAAWVRDHLLRFPFVAEFDMYLEQPRYFGRMADWLQGRCEDLLVDRDAVKNSVQVLMRWLMWTYPGRYRLEVPGHSERFGRADGDWSSRR